MAETNRMHTRKDQWEKRGKVGGEGRAGPSRTETFPPTRAPACVRIVFVTLRCQSKPMIVVIKAWDALAPNMYFTIQHLHLHQLVVMSRREDFCIHTQHQISVNCRYSADYICMDWLTMVPIAFNWLYDSEERRQSFFSPLNSRSTVKIL